MNKKVTITREFTAEDLRKLADRIDRNSKGDYSGIVKMNITVTTAAIDIDIVQPSAYAECNGYHHARHSEWLYLESESEAR